MQNSFKLISVKSADIASGALEPEVMAAITASLCSLLATNNIALRIARTGSLWKQTGRQRI